MTQTEFTQRVLTMQDRLYRVSCTLLRCEADREDAVQSALEKAWRGRFLLRQEQYMETWLTRILINECYAIMRRSRRIIRKFGARRIVDGHTLLRRTERHERVFAAPLVEHAVARHIV